MSIESFCKDLGRDCEAFSKGLLYGFQYGVTEAKKLDDASKVNDLNRGLEELPTLTDSAYPAADPIIYIQEDHHFV
ncbi:hypothetical protein IC220_03890 [Wolbachia endosymbiont of Pentalonia nigronervosa]|jgi:hypothetical protein|uniref:hypothetical protein n=1 Tax=Wolbachia endosymbiont of Pentalonia nigronervosa TaxID=1301914 RepID=UPI00165F7026|nr:hypothetical protein [Wolbachia endosymbiont of Pentalonia nigronervosa]MBD0391592.1 hypothetical protein [Wolbachia endosymbiont of Pentalonia nigronervosa]